jgi:hypothetical protein
MNDTQNKNLLGAVTGVLAGTNQPTINTVVSFDENSFNKSVMISGGVGILMLIIWGLARHFSNPK